MLSFSPFLPLSSAAPLWLSQSPSDGQSGTRVLTLPSYAKINWTLEVLGPRPDGYHEIRTILQTIDLADTLHLELCDSGVEIVCDHPGVPSDERNIVYRAAVLLRHAKGVRFGARIRILKRIPVAAGLGGGSSNAAVALLALARLWDLPLTVEELFDLGAQLGSDVPFFFYGGTALGVGRGAEVYPLPDVHAEHLLLVNPGIEIPTQWAYEQLTKRALVSKIPFSCAAVFRASRASFLARSGSDFAPEAKNDLEEGVLDEYPEIRRVFERLRETRPRVVRLSGSGSTVFALFDDAEGLEQAEAQLSTEPWLRIRSRTVSRKEYWSLVARCWS